MPYLPTTTDSPTSFPILFGKDWATQLRMVAEKWRTQFPLIVYNPINMATTVRADANVPVGENGATKWDAVYGESVDPAMTSLMQPHLSGTLKAFDTEVYRPPVQVHLRTDVDVSDEDLKRWGFEKKEDMVAIAAVSELDALSLTVNPGDWFVWNAKEYAVKKVGFDGRWKNTTAYLFVVLNCTTRRSGS